MTPDEYLESINVSDEYKILIKALAVAQDEVIGDDGFKSLPEETQKDLYGHSKQYQILLTEQLAEEESVDSEFQSRGNSVASSRSVESPSADEFKDQLEELAQQQQTVIANLAQKFSPKKPAFSPAIPTIQETEQMVVAPDDHKNWLPDVVSVVQDKTMVPPVAIALQPSPPTEPVANPDGSNVTPLPQQTVALTTQPASDTSNQTPTVAAPVRSNLFSTSATVAANTAGTTWSMESITTAMSDVSNLTDDLSEFEYEGFDINFFIQMVAGKAEAGGKTREEFARDMRTLTGVAVMRGTNKERILEKTSRSGAASLRTLFNFYGVENNDEKKSVGKEKVIMGRFPACFPVVAARLLARGIIRPIHTEGTIPTYLRFMGSASLIPSTNQDLFNAYVAFATKFDVIVNGSDNADADKVKRFAEISWRSNQYNDVQRATILDSLARFRNA